MTELIPDLESPWGRYKLCGYKAILHRALTSLPPLRICRRIGLWLRRPLKYGIHTPVDVELWGLKLRLMPRGNLCEERLISLPQFFDAQERKFIAERLRPGATFVDLGANVGSYSLWTFSSIGEDANVHAIEPDPQLCERLEFNLRTNNIKSVRVHQLAISDHQGEASLQLGSGNLGTSKIGSQEGSGIKVKVTTLADFLTRQGISAVDALKIDVEGHERIILEHFFESSPRSLWPRLVICESLEKGGDHGAATVIESAGYRLVKLTRMNAIYELSNKSQAIHTAMTEWS